MITIEDRICEVCGQPVHAGMTNQDGDFCVHEECFEKFMDELYGKRRWMEVNDDCQGGYYIASDDTVAGGHFGTGIYYTDWEDEYEGVDFPLECVETCPHCEGENIYPNYNPIANGYKAICKHCGEEIFLCDECIHAADNKEHRCDWHEMETGGRCFRGTTTLKKFKEENCV